MENVILGAPYLTLRSGQTKNFGGKCTEFICMDLSHIICVFEHTKNPPLTECAKWLFLG